MEKREKKKGKRRRKKEKTRDALLVTEGMQTENDSESEND